MGSTTAAFLYDTLSPLTFSNTFPADDADAEAYEVFRNTITSTAGPSSEIPAADYFSLDVTVTDTASHEPFTTPNARPRHGDANDDASPVSWLRSGRRFRSPMLQLHKGLLLSRA